MSPARADVVNAVELAGRAAELDRDLDLSQLPRLQEAGALGGTRAHARLAFGLFEGRPLIEARIGGTVELLCQRCMTPCRYEIDETAALIVVEEDRDEVPGGYEPCVAVAEHVSISAVIEEQLLLALPLVPKHADVSDCATPAGADRRDDDRGDRQRPFANLRDLLDKRRP